MQLYMLDTNIAAYLLRGQFPALDAQIRSVPPTQLCISAVTRGEMLYGVNLKPEATNLSRLTQQFLRAVECLAWDSAAATHFADIAATLQRAGAGIGAMDTMIAGHARAVGAIMVTDNTRHFERVDGLRLENWTQGPRGDKSLFTQ
jgi:tRNA(fMet)-specific endonuclease VapC